VKHPTRVAAAISMLAGGLMVTSDARADSAAPPDDLQAEAELLFDQGKALLAKNDWAPACALFDASAKIVEAVPALVKVARCRAREGKRVQAIEVYGRALALQPWPELERLVRAELFEIQEETPSIRVILIEPASGVTLRRNGQLLSPDAGPRLWTDVGVAEHIEARAPGYRPATFDVSAKASGEVIDVRVSLVADEPAPRPPTVQTVPPRPAAVQAPLGWAFAGSGALALALGAGFGVEYLVRRESLFDDCTGTLASGAHVCPASTGDRYDNAVEARTRAAILLGLGTALATTGVILLVTTAKDDKPRIALAGLARPSAHERHRASCWVGVGPSVVELGGVF